MECTIISLHFIFIATSCDSLHAAVYILVSWYYVKEMKDIYHCYLSQSFLYIYIYMCVCVCVCNSVFRQNISATLLFIIRT